MLKIDKYNMIARHNYVQLSFYNWILLIEMLASLPKGLNLTICLGEQIQTLHMPEKVPFKRQHTMQHIPLEAINY